ncbi:hypothetical protein WA171_005472 [Blastocystis sp. BT1]
MALVLPAAEYTRLPKYDSDEEAIKTFLQTFEVRSKSRSHGEKKYVNMITEVKQLKRSIVEVCLTDIANSDQSNLVPNIISNTMRYTELFEDAVDEILPTINVTVEPTVGADLFNQHRAEVAAAQSAEEQESFESRQVRKELARRYNIVFTPDTVNDYHEYSIREVDSQKMGKYVTIKGIVTRVGEMLPMLRVATYVCRTCGYENYQRITKRSFTPLKTCTSPMCRKNHDHGDLVLNLRSCKWVKYQEVVLQEISDQIPTGHIPRVLNVQLRGSIAQSCVPGDVVSISGCYLPTPYTGLQALRAGLITDTFFFVHHVFHHNTAENVVTSEQSIARAVKKLSRQDDVYERLAESLAPEIYGHSDIKKALLLQLISGVTRTTSDGMKIRGEINILLMGDPGVAKSQLLKYISNVAPRGVYTTGKGSSSVGLTAGVLRDPETNELKVEGGALILADNGICCIDEFDKMNDMDRTSIHEVMEQQTISISKAGIQTTLNARVSLLCAANPLYGRYNVRKTPGENINLPTALLSRFDLIFLILDRPDQDLDRELAEHIAYVHKNGHSMEESTTQIIPLDVIRGYIAEAQKYNPMIPDDLISYIADTYVNSRQIDFKAAKKNDELFAMTARQLLSTLRLAQAHAKLHFRDMVTADDVEEALRLVYMSKASVVEADDIKGKPEDVLSSIFAIIREYCVAKEHTSIEVDEIQRYVARKGYSAMQFEQCLQHYQQLNIWTLSANDTKLTFVI